MSKLVFIPFLLVCSLCFAQSDLQNLYDSARHNSNLNLAQKVNHLANESHEKKLLANSYFLMAYLQKKDEKFYEAVSNYFNALSAYRTLGDIKQVANVTENIANIYNATGFHDKALEYYYDVIRIRTSLADTAGLIKVNSATGLQLQEMGRYDEALALYSETLNMAQITNDKHRVYWINNNIGRIYRSLHDFPKARAAYEKSMEAAINKNDIGEVYNNLGYLYLTFNDTLAAYKYLKESLNMLSDHMFIGTAYTNLAYIYEKRNSDSTQLFFEKSFSFFKDHQITMSEEYFEVCRKLKEINRANGNLQEALKYSDNIDQLTTDLLELRINLNDMYNQYQVEAATYKFASEEKARALAKQLKIDQYIKWALAVLAVILITLLIILYRKNRKIQFAQDTARKIYKVIHS
ncbi:tetratricopeptide repeat protein [Fulvivirga sp. 29W222]|uniref:Tetratricopeptide repeat protein n=1 Tax=Fulvivirga marina TaxID=2494733 RepID=A0A937FX86_9BACT|nr:tetratricopeptide repeat protein [Fulvivirga marina]MBL6446198.1 tetratricopeptide repeat protein [Fulvivirga marina]